MKKLISLLLCLVMILGVMTACGDSNDDGASGGKGGIVGTWKANLSLEEYGELGDLGEMEEYIDVDKLVIGVNLKFNTNGTYKLTVDEKSIDKLVDVMCDGMDDYVKDVASAYGMTYKEMLSALGASNIREFLEDAGMMEAFDELKEMNESGEYTFEDGILTLDGDDVDFELEGNTLYLEIEGMEVKFTRK